MFTENQFGMRITTGLFPIAVFVLILVSMFVGWSNALIASAFLIAMVFVFWISVNRIRGPIQWASFSSKYTSKDVYFFQGRDVDEFEEFADQMTTLISNARMAEASGELAE